MVYTRRVKGQELTFGVSGKLYKDALVMFDRQTNSLWTQLDGSVLRGRLQGARLQPVAAVQTSWGEWKRLHPDTLVLKKDRSVSGSAYSRYFSDPTKLGIAGTQNPDLRLPGKTLVVTLRQGSDALAVPLEALKKNLLHQSVVGGTPVAILYSPQHATARVFDRRVSGKTLGFRVVEEGTAVLPRDQQTGTLWSPVSGHAIEGPLRSQQLEPVPHLVNYWFAWVAYNPRTRLEP